MSCRKAATCLCRLSTLAALQESGWDSVSHLFLFAAKVYSRRMAALARPHDAWWSPILSHSSLKNMTSFFYHWGRSCRAISDGHCVFPWPGSWSVLSFLCVNEHREHYKLYGWEAMSRETWKTKATHLVFQELSSCSQAYALSSIVTPGKQRKKKTAMCFQWVSLGPGGKHDTSGSCLCAVRNNVMPSRSSISALGKRSVHMSTIIEWWMDNKN